MTDIEMKREIVLLEAALAEAMRRITMMAGSNADDFRWYQNAARRAHQSMMERHAQAMSRLP